MNTRRLGHDQEQTAAPLAPPRRARDDGPGAALAALAVARPGPTPTQLLRTALPVLQRDVGNQAMVQQIRDGGLPIQRLNLADHEGDGHTLARHVNVDDAYIKQRVDSGAVTKASRWKDKATADAVVTAALAQPSARRKIRKVVEGQGATTHDAASAATNGRFYRGTLTGSKDVEIIIRRKTVAPFWYILTAFPGNSDGVPVVEPAPAQPAAAVAPPAPARPAAGAWGARSGVDALLGRG